MLLRYFRKIDAYSGLRLFALVLVCVIGVVVTSGDSRRDHVFFLFIFFFTGLLCWMFFKDRWTFKGSQFRFLVAVLFVILWSSEFVSHTFLVAALVLESNWQFTENFRRRRNPVWIFHSAMLSALTLIFFSHDAWFIGVASFVALLIVGKPQLANLLQWIFGFGLVIILPLLLSQNFFPDFQYRTPEIQEVPVEWWVVPALVLLITLNQFTIFYRKADNLNKSRSLLALTWTLLGVLFASLIGGEGGFVLVLLGLSYQASYAMYYFKRKGWIEIGFLLLMIYSVAYSFNYIEFL